jgi:hypothetical protein
MFLCGAESGSDLEETSPGLANRGNIRLKVEATLTVKRFFCEGLCYAGTNYVSRKLV